MVIRIMPKRFWAGPLGLHDDDWLTIWAVLCNRSKSAQSTNLIAFRVRERKSQIVEMLNYTAERMGVSPEDLKKMILSGEYKGGDLEAAPGADDLLPPLGDD